MSEQVPDGLDNVDDLFIWWATTLHKDGKIPLYSREIASMFREKHGHILNSNRVTKLLTVAGLEWVRSPLDVDNMPKTKIELLSIRVEHLSKVVDSLRTQIITLQNACYPGREHM